MPSFDPVPNAPAPGADSDLWKQQDAADEDAIRNLLDSAEGPDSDLNAFLANETIDQSGKADDAMDYGDISDDDDLPDEEPATVTAAATTAAAKSGSNDATSLGDSGTNGNLPEDANDLDDDDLFGERDSSPFGNLFGPDTPEGPAEEKSEADAAIKGPVIVPESSFRDPLFDSVEDEDFDMLAEQTNQDPDIPPAIESAEELLRQKWPDFKQGVVLEWNSLLPPKPSKYISKKPLRKMKPLITSKLSLDIAPDQEKIFRLPDSNRRKAYDPENSNFVQLGLAKEARQATTDNEISLDNDEDDDPIAGFTLQDIATVCFDFSTEISSAEHLVTAAEDALEVPNAKREPNADDADGDDEWDAIFMDVDSERPKKKLRVIDTRLPDIPRYTAPSFDDFENHTKRLGKRVYVDFTDPHLHLEEVSVEVLAKRQKAEASNKRNATGNLGRRTKSRFNIANDDAYEMLKENHKHKVRATLGNINVEHSLPALKLAWPYYKVKLNETPDRYHRPPLRTRQFVNRDIEFHRRGHVKKKLTKGKAHEVFRETKDLSLNDNASAVLFEYCERIPTVLSKFGMANRVINYYRKVDAADEKMPEKLDVGETHVLLPEDRSPFSIFGTVNPGQMVPTFHNQMYRAPLFKHKVRTGDFLLGRSSTGLYGSKWYLRNIDHIYVVGQTFPSVEVPGPHSRKVTNASKNRIKMISYRLMHKDPGQLVNLSDITKHIADSTDAQNRQKLKEFLSYAKSEKGQWKLREGEVLMDEERIRAMIKPEDTCLIDGMALGLKMLEDAGFDPKNAVLEDEESDDDEEGGGGGPGAKSKGAKKTQEKAEEALADKMAPWKTSKAFIDACAGKAMLQLHGEGDPTGHGLGFSFIRTSMKGGYIEAVQGPLATSADAMERQKRENNGHAYNVKRQEAMYRDGISEIWDKQRSTLSDPQLHDDNDVLHTVDEDERFNTHAPTHANANGQTPIAEDGFSQISGLTSASRAISKRKLRITRQMRQPDGSIAPVEEVVEDPVVIAHYLKRRDEADINPTSLYDILPTGNADRDRLGIKKVEEELARLKKNRDRRKTREKQKELHRRVGSNGALEALSPEPGTPGSTTGHSPSALTSAGGGNGPLSAGGASASGGGGGPPPAPEPKSTGTTRKCANCGQVGHIKTNKKLCPLLNGTIKAAEPQDVGGFGGFSAPAPLPQIPGAGSPPM